MKQIQGRHSFDWLQGERHWLGMIDGALSLTDFKRLHARFRLLNWVSFWTENRKRDVRIGDIQITCVLQTVFE